MKKIFILIAVMTACFYFNGMAQTAYIANSGDNTVSVINVATNTVVATIPVGIEPYGVSFSPDGSKVYATSDFSQTVSIINTSTDLVSSTIPVGTVSSCVTVSPDGSKVYVANIFPNAVSVIDTISNTVTATIPVNTGPVGLSVSPDGSKVYVTNFNNNSVNVINTATNSVTDTIVVGTNPQGIVVNHDGTKVYVTNWGYNGNGNTISVINTATNTVSTTITVGSAPYGISISPDGSKVLVANHNDNTVSVINTAADTVSATILVGSYPYAFGNFISSYISPCFIFTPVITPSGSTTFCQGDSVTLTSDSSTSYLWSNGATDRSIMVNTSGGYSVTITDINGCTASSAITTITVNPAYTQNITASICQGNTYTFPDGSTSMIDTIETSHFTTINSCDSIIITTLTVNPIYNQNITASICQGNTYTFPDGTTSTVSTVHTSPFTAMNTCDSSITTTLTVHALPSPSITPDGSINFCAGDSVHLTSDSASTYLWSTGATTQTITATISGDYLVTVTDSNGCIGSSFNTTVAVDSPAIPTITPVLTLLASSSFTGNQWLLNTIPINGATNFIYLATISGCYSVMVTDANGCTAVSDTVCITIPNGINELSMDEGISIFPNPNNGTFTISYYLPQSHCQLRIKDVLGRTLYSYSIYNIEGKETLTFPLSNGIYFWEMISSDGLQINHSVLQKGKLVVIRN